MILRFSEEFHKCTNGLPELSLNGRTVGECLNQAFEVYPQLYVHLMDNEAQVALESYFTLNGEHIYSAQECATEVGKADVLELVHGVPAGRSGKAMGYVMSAVQIIAGTVMVLTGNFLGIGLIISGIVSMTATFMQPDITLTPDAGGSVNGSAAYTFNGIRNTTAVGTPLQVVYGQFRVGGQFLNVFTEASSKPQITWDSSNTSNPIQNVELAYEVLHAHIGLCEGEIEAATDFLINKLPTNFYNSIEFVDDHGVVKPDNIRYGKASQAPMPKFNRTANTASISRKVLRPATLPTSPVGALQYTDTPLYGYYDYARNIQVYGYYTGGPFVYKETSAGDPNALVIKWDNRNPYLDGPPWAPTQYKLGSYTVKRTYATDVPLPISYDTTGATVITTQAEATGFTVVLSLPGLYQMSQKDGYLYTTVGVSILYRKQGDTQWTIHTLSEVIAGKQRAEIVKTYVIPPTGSLPLAMYEIAVIRNTDDHTGWANFVDDVYIKELTEYKDTALSYPHTAQLGAVIRASDQISGSLPTITTLVKGRKIAVPVDDSNHPILDYVADASVWSGQLSWDEETQTGFKVWSDNPVWCIYDLLTNKRFGLADYYKINPDKLPLMRAKFFLEANYCNYLLEYTKADGTTATRKRFTLNMVIDQSKSASEWLAAMASTCRATCFYSEGIFWVDIDKPRPITQVFNMSNIKEFTQVGTSYRSIPNCFEVQFPNPDLDYEIDSYRVESKQLRSNPHMEERKRSLTFMGVTDSEQTKALAKYALVTGQYLTKFVTFKTGTDGLRCMVTDAIAIQHDVPQTGWGGKVTEVVYHDDTKEAILHLSTPFHYTDGMGALQITLQQGGGTPVTLPVAQPTSATVEVITADCSSDFIPAVDASYVLTVTTNGVARYKVLSIRRNGDEECEINAVQYDERIYAMADSTADIGIITTPSTLANPKRVSVRNTTASVKIYQDSAGVVKTGVEVFWEVPSGNSFWTGAMVNWALAGTFNYQALPVTTAGYAFIPDVGIAGNYQIVVTSTYKTGRQTINDALLDDIYRPYVTVAVTPNVPNGGFQGGVSGLEVIGSLDGTYSGKECRLRWRAPVVLDQYVLSDTTAAATGNNTASWLAYYLVEVYNLDNSLRRVSRVNTEAFVYTHEMNHEDGTPVRSYNVVVTAVDRLGNSSTPVSLRVTNPVPAALA